MPPTEAQVTVPEEDTLEVVPVRAAPAARKERRPLLPRPRRAAPEDEASPRRARPPLRGNSDAARELVAAKARARAAAPAAPAAEPQPEAPALPSAAANLAPRLAKITRHEDVAAEMPGLYAFKPKRTVRRLLTIALLAALAVTASFARIAVEARSSVTIGVAVIAGFATVMVWAIRAGASVTTLAVHQGQLEVVQQGARFVFDMASPYTMLELHGQPGQRGWYVLFPRRGMPPFKVDASMVDPDDFMRVLRFFRPELRS